MPTYTQEVKWLRGGFHYQTEWAEGGRRSRYRGIVGASESVSITNVEMEGKYFRERYCCANNIRSLSPLERYLRSKEWDEVTSLFYDVTE